VIAVASSDKFAGGLPRLRIRALDGAAALLLLGLAAALAYAGARHNAELGELLIQAAWVPMFAAAYRYGFRGALRAAAGAVTVITSIFVLDDFWKADLYLTNIAIIAVITPAFGKFVDRSRQQSRLRTEQLEHAVEERTQQLQWHANELTDVMHGLETARREALRCLGLVAEFHNVETAAHTERVGVLAGLIGAELGLPDEEVQVIREAAALHDIGKIGLSDSILLKAGTLSRLERLQMQRHTELGARLLCGTTSPVLRLAARIALSHHERWDGNGYPNRLAGESIPLAARIVALADAYDAICHTRTYKPAVPAADAVAEIRRCSGSHFDPVVVAAFTRLANRLGDD